MFPSALLIPLEHLARKCPRSGTARRTKPSVSCPVVPRGLTHSRTGGVAGSRETNLGPSRDAVSGFKRAPIVAIWRICANSGLQKQTVPRFRLGRSRLAWETPARHDGAQETGFAADGTCAGLCARPGGCWSLHPVPMRSVTASTGVQVSCQSVEILGLGPDGLITIVVHTRGFHAGSVRAKPFNKVSKIPVGLG